MKKQSRRDKLHDKMTKLVGQMAAIREEMRRLDAPSLEEVKKTHEGVYYMHPVKPVEGNHRLYYHCLEVTDVDTGLFKVIEINKDGSFELSIEQEDLEWVRRDSKVIDKAAFDGALEEIESFTRTFREREK